MENPEFFKLATWTGYEPFNICDDRSKFLDVKASDNFDGCHGSIDELSKIIAEKVGLPLRIVDEKGSTCPDQICTDNVETYKALHDIAQGTYDMSTTLYVLTKERLAELDILPITWSHDTFVTCASEPAYYKVKAREYLFY